MLKCDKVIKYKVKLCKTVTQHEKFGYLSWAQV